MRATKVPLRPSGTSKLSPRSRATSLLSESRCCATASHPDGDCGGLTKSDDADLIRDVCLDINKAEVKLRQLKEARRRCGSIQRRVLQEADIRLIAAIVAAFCSRLGATNDAAAPIARGRKRWPRHARRLRR
jgi:hypothetical protein